ncbi:hypothetical protein LCGC14_0220160 [marine sediment metagenome]|uniref:Uncharacterized protein n=1 Tax=marine sediment metagenome TaxID=412755 RepID=A0A0F9WXK2_9ZZZZ
MDKTLVKYRTLGSKFNSYAVVPTLFLSGLLDWLKLSECATIISTTDNYQRILRQSELSDLAAPESWPSYGQCKGYILAVDMLECR